jgi:hypothetical protein
MAPHHELLRASLRTFLGYLLITLVALPVTIINVLNLLVELMASDLSREEFAAGAAVALVAGGLVAWFMRLMWPRWVDAFANPPRGGIRRRVIRWAVDRKVEAAVLETVAACFVGVSAYAMSHAAPFVWDRPADAGPTWTEVAVVASVGWFTLKAVDSWWSAIRDLRIASWRAEAVAVRRRYRPTADDE